MDLNSLALITTTDNGVPTLKARSELHLARRLWHACGVILILVIFHNVTRQTALTALAIALFVVLPVDYLRLRQPNLNKSIVNMFRMFLRDSEMHGLSGMSYLLLGTMFVVALFPRHIASLSLFLLAFGDPMASFVGILYGKDKLIGNKSLQGTLAAFVVCAIVGFIFYFSKGLMMDRIFIAALLTGFIGAISEVFPLGRIDDNFSFPVLSACMLWLLFFLLGGFPN